MRKPTSSQIPEGQDEVYFNKDRTTRSWIVDRSLCRIQSCDPQISQRIRSWSFSTPFAVGLNNSLRAFIVPRKRWRWALKRLEIPLPVKKLQRIVKGIKFGRQNLNKGSLATGQKEINGAGDTISSRTGKRASHDNRSL